MLTKKKLLLAVLFILLYLPQGFTQSKWTIVKTELVYKNAPFKQCHASTMVETQTGELLLSCFGGSQEGKNDVMIWLSKLSDIEKPPVEVADGIVNDTLRYPAWNPVLFQTKKGKLFLFYKVGPNPREWWGMVKTSANNGRTWSAAQKLPKGVLGPIKNKPVQLADGTIVSPSSVEETEQRWRVFMERSTDEGRSWTVTPVDTAGKFDVIQPSVLQYKGSRLQILCRSKQGNVIQSWSSNKGKTWGKLSKTNLLNPNSGTDAVTLKSGEQLIVYNPDVPGKDWFNGRGKLRVASSTDGNTWTDVMVLENGEKEEFSYPAIIQTRNGDVHITYTYDRKNIKHVVIKQL